MTDSRSGCVRISWFTGLSRCSDSSWNGMPEVLARYTAWLAPRARRYGRSPVPSGDRRCAAGQLSSAKPSTQAKAL